MTLLHMTVSKTCMIFTGLFLYMSALPSIGGERLFERHDGIMNE